MAPNSSESGGSDSDPVNSVMLIKSSSSSIASGVGK
jgi:hypothetical protein